MDRTLITTMQQVDLAEGGAQCTDEAEGGAQCTDEAEGGAQCTDEAEGRAQCTDQTEGVTQCTDQAIQKQIHNITTDLYYECKQHALGMPTEHAYLPTYVNSGSYPCNVTHTSRGSTVHTLVEVLLYTH